MTEGASGTERRQEAEAFRRFNVNPSGAPRQLPLHKGAMSRCKFRLCAAEKAEAKAKVSTPKTAEKRKSRTLLQSLRDSSLSEGAFVCACFFFVPQKNKGNFQDFKSKNLHIFPLWQCSASLCAFLREEGGTRERDGRSLRDGRAAESRGFSAFQRQSLRRSAPAPFTQGSHGLLQISALCRRESKGEI